jgi:hypothetical protein
VSTDVIALVVAVVGVGGTLTSSVLSQQLAMRARKQENEAQRQQRLDERDEERLRTAFKDRRDICIALNTSARDFRQALKNCLFEGLDEKGAELEQARQAFTRRYGEAQMILSETVLKSASTASGYLADAYGVLKKATAGPIDKDEREKLESYLDHAVRRALRDLREVMRLDLGVTDRGR